MINSGVIKADKFFRNCPGTRTIRYPLHFHIRTGLAGIDITKTLDGRVLMIANPLSEWRFVYRVNDLLEIMGRNSYGRVFGFKTPWLSVAFFERGKDAN